MNTVAILVGTHLGAAIGGFVLGLLYHKQVLAEAARISGQAAKTVSTIQNDAKSL